ncbi:flavin-containing monooxygenase [Rhodococcus marinonascens]|uniref:flavin-containing monooxygenase n=1 Tax=Rhodococcus marinonascens TaxID=38311 RepID=UPI00093362BA|nr:NAD(P)/FAD-dependent oxidoreductase [Rhodococcus marinonascens]
MAHADTATDIHDAKTPVEHLDVLIIGAGLSGIGAACHVKKSFPHRTFAILESRESMGGTWDLFRYPGIRSDSDMYTLGYRFKPWEKDQSIADGADILEYLEETATDHGIDRNIRFRHRVVRAEWSTADSQWRVDAERTDTGEIVRLTTDFLMSCSGYYRYDEGYTPEFPGIDQFEGRVVHPQHWPDDLDYAGKRVVVIGSGATAVTLAPAMSAEAAHVTMLQRSPTYILALPGADKVANGLRRLLPSRLAYALTRLKNATVSTAIYQLCQRYPKFMKGRIRQLQKGLLPEGYDIDTHLTPRYNPWDQRLCLVPDGDLFQSISDGNVSIVTDHIDTFTDTGITLKSGGDLDADIVVTATGLNLLAFGGMTLAVDGRDIDLSETMAYKGMMLSGVPNFAFVVGYTNASWTLKADLVCEYVCRLLAHMDENGYAQCAPERNPSVAEEPFLDFAAGYVLRSVESFPKQGSEAPWRLRMNYFRDLVTLRHGKVADDAMMFSGTRSLTAEPARR